MFSTRFTTMRDMRSEYHARWSLTFGFKPTALHRKCWELTYVAETLGAAGKLKHGNSGVGFGCGSEQCPRLFAEYGASVLATDLLGPGWERTHQHFNLLSQHPNINCRIVDMNWLNGSSGRQPVPYEAFDFAWSVCSMDHCGSAWLTKRFLLNQMNCLSVGGVSAHTAEYTLGSSLPRSGSTSFLTPADLLDIESLSRALGYELAPIDWFLGDDYLDNYIDANPYKGPAHLKMCPGRSDWATCVGFALRKTSAGIFEVPSDEVAARRLIRSRSS